MSRAKNWQPVNDSSRMPYEKRTPMTFDAPQSEAYREGWERIFGRGADRPADFSGANEQKVSVVDGLPTLIDEDPNHCLCESNGLCCKCGGNLSDECSNPGAGE